MHGYMAFRVSLVGLLVVAFAPKSKQPNQKGWLSPKAIAKSNFHLVQPGPLLSLAFGSKNYSLATGYTHTPSRRKKSQQTDYTHAPAIGAKNEKNTQGHYIWNSFENKHIV